MSSKKGNIIGWKEAIADAERKLTEGRIYVARIRSAIRTMKEKMEAGEAWPRQLTGHNSGQQHSV